MDMKKILLAMATTFLFTGIVVADNVVVSDIVLPKGGMVKLDVNYHFNGDVLYKGFQMDLDLPKSVTMEKDNAGNLVFESGNALSDHTISTRTLSSGKERFMVVSMNNTVLSGTDGTLFSIFLHDDGSQETGSTFTVDVNGILFTNAEGKSVPFSDTSFTITIGDKERTILDENDTAIPATENDVNVLVKRTIGIVV